MRRGAIVRILGLGIVITILVGLVAVLIPWLPDPASKQMERIEDVYWFATIICIGIFALVMSVLIYSVMTFRAAPEDESDGPSIHGHTGLEIVWTVVPAILVIAIGVVSAVVLSQNGDAGKNPMTIKVFAQQFSWRFEYPDSKGLKSYELVLPVDRNITFELQSADVIHSFWIPAMGQKQDVVPGIDTSIVITPTQDGPLPARLHRALRARPCDDALARDASSRRPTSTSGSKEQQGGGGKERRRRRRVLVGRLRRLPCVQAGRTRTGRSARTSTTSRPTRRRRARIPTAYVKESIVDPNKVIANGYAEGRDARGLRRVAVAEGDRRPRHVSDGRDAVNESRKGADRVSVVEHTSHDTGSRRAASRSAAS